MTMKRSNITCPLFLIFVSGLSSHSAEKPAGIADGYKLLFKQKFDAEPSAKDFVFTDSKAWKWSKEENGGTLELTQQSQFTPAVRSPVNIAMIADKVFTDFVLDADLIQTGKEPIMVAEDKTFGAGCIGFGSFDDTGKVDNIRIWGPSMEAKRTELFKRNDGASAQ